MITRQVQSETVAKLAGVGLSQLPFKFNRYRGFDIKPSEIQVSQPVYERLKAAIGNEEKQTLSIKTVAGPGDGNQAVEKTYAVRVVSLTQNSDHSGVVVLHDSRSVLERIVMPNDINVIQSTLDSGQIVYESATVGDVAPYVDADTLEVFIENLNTAIAARGFDITLSLSQKVVDRDITLRDNIFVARMTALKALKAIFSEISLSIFVQPDGNILVVDATPEQESAIEALSAIKFKVKPQWANANRKQLGVPKNIIGLYTRMRQFIVQFGDADVDKSTESVPVSRIRSSQVYTGRNSTYEMLQDFVESFSSKFADGDEVTDAQVAENLISGAWNSTSIQTYFEPPAPLTDTITGFTESLRVGLSQAIVPTIMKDWRMLFQMNLWDSPAPPREWIFGAFDDDGNFTPKAVKAGYVDFLVKPVEDPTLVTKNIDLSKIRRTKTNDFGEAPFAVAWDGERGLEQGVMRLLPTTGQNIRDRRPGALDSEDVLVQTRQATKVQDEFTANFEKVIWSSDSVWYPEFTKTFLVEVNIITPDRRRTDDSDPYTAYHEVSVDGLPDGDIEDFYVQIDDRVTANFPSLVTGFPANVDVLEVDMERRAAVIRSFFSQRLGGTAQAHALQTHELLAEQAMLEANIEVHADGLGVVMTEIVMGGYVDRTTGVQKTNKRIVLTGQHKQQISTVKFKEAQTESGAN